MRLACVNSDICEYCVGGSRIYNLSKARQMESLKTVSKEKS